MQPGRDLWWHELTAGAAATSIPVWVNAEHPLFLLYTSGSTGKPKGIQHSSAGYLLGVKLSARWVFDLHDDDVFWCTADVGWVTGHSYVAYGPLASGATIVMYEGAPTFPDGGRFWQICEQHGVTIFYTAPTAIRALMRLGDEIPAKYDLSRLRLLGSVGEPINPEAWMWYQRVIGREKCPIVDTWWQTETGAIMICAAAGRDADQAWFLHAPVARHICRYCRRSRQRRDPAGCRWLPRHPQTLAIDAAHHLGRQRPLPKDLLGKIPEAFLCRGRQRASRQGRLLLDHGPHRRRAECRRASASARWKSNPRWSRMCASPNPPWLASSTTSRAKPCSPMWSARARARKARRPNS